MVSLYSVRVISMVVLLYANAGINPNFKCSILKHGFKTIFVFSLNISQRPNRNTVMFLVNNKTIDTIRLYNNTCYNKNRACSNDICACASTGNVFKMKYVYQKEAVTINTMFGVQMTIKDRNGNGMQMTLHRLFDGKEFGKLMTVNTPNAHEFTQTETIVSANKRSSGTGDKGVLTAIFIIAAVVGMVLKLCHGYRIISSCKAA